MSEYPTLDVMKSDVPRRPRRLQTACRACLESRAPVLLQRRARWVEQLGCDLEQALRSGRAALALAPSSDGTPGIPSLIAVWLISQVGKAVGLQKPVNLSKVTNKEDLRSVGGVARLLHVAFHPVSQGAVA